VNVAETDQLSVASDEGSLLVERDSTSTEIVRLDASPPASVPVVRNALQPAISDDGRWLAYLRTLKGRASIWVADMEGSQNETGVTGPALDVYDLSAGPGEKLLFSAMNRDGQLGLFQRDIRGSTVALGIPNARYPALSPDGQWLAYSLLKRGTWHLMLREWRSGVDRQLGMSDCNEFSPVWERDSRTLIYVSDCGRGLWQNSLYRRRVVP
jgi:Tol biopolymer transport system component